MITIFNIFSSLLLSVILFSNSQINPAAICCLHTSSHKCNTNCPSWQSAFMYRRILLFFRRIVKSKRIQLYRFGLSILTVMTWRCEGKDRGGLRH